MKCIVIGGAGFIGSHLSEALLAQGYKVTVFGRAESRYLNHLQKMGATLQIGNFLNPDDLGSAISGHDVLYHLVSATVPQTSNNDPAYDIDSNVLATLRLLDLARAARIKKIIFASSGGTVYGIPQVIPIKEIHPTEPISSYGIVKLTIEKYLHLYWALYKLDYCILRIANAYGERQLVSETQGVIPAFLDKMIRQQEISIWGDGSVIRDYIHVSDIVSALVKAATYNGDLKIFNVGGGQGHSLNDIMGVIEYISSRSMQSRYMPGRVFDVPVNVLDISRAKMNLNWHPSVGLFEGISRMYEWMLKEKKM
jgi:UDP-glucose 4-epimerase